MAEQFKNSNWLYQLKGEVCGPISQKRLVEKLLAGELGLKTLVAQEGSAFHAVYEISDFYEIAQRLRKKALRNQHSTQKNLQRMMLIVCSCCFVMACYMTALGAYEKSEENKQAYQRVLVQIEEAAKLPTLTEEKIPFVPWPTSSEKAASEVTSASFNKRHAKARSAETSNRFLSKTAPLASDVATETATDGVDAGAGSVSTCQLSQQVIFQIIKKHIVSLNRCVDLEKQQHPKGLPEVLELSFVVTNSGRVTEFMIQDEAYKEGALAGCLLKIFMAIRFPVSHGANCPVDLPMRIP